MPFTALRSLFLQLSRRLPHRQCALSAKLGCIPSLLFPFVFSLLVSVLQHHPCCIRKRHAAQPGAAASPPPSVTQSSAGRIARLVKSDASHHTHTSSQLRLASSLQLIPRHVAPSGKCAFYLVSENSSQLYATDTFCVDAASAHETTPTSSRDVPNRRAQTTTRLPCSAELTSSLCTWSLLWLRFQPSSSIVTTMMTGTTVHKVQDLANTTTNQGLAVCFHRT